MNRVHEPIDMRTLAYLLLFLVVTLSRASAPAETFTVNPAQSEVTFSFADALHAVKGTFHVESGTIQFDPASPEVSGSIVVAAGSGKSGNDTRDHKMTTDILNAPKFAEASFVPKHVNGTISATGDSTVQVDGIFTLHGAPHDLTVPMQIHIDGKACTAKTHFAIPYVKWGLKDPSNFLIHVDKEVTLDIALTGQVSGTVQP
jgi:polyisoprenoid-binding protein YceI